MVRRNVAGREALPIGLEPVAGTTADHDRFFCW